MKTLKLAVVATLVAFAMVSVANADGFKIKPKPVKVVNLTLERAVSIPGLVAAMYEQLDKDDFLVGTSHTMVAEVTYRGVLYRISGTLSQWTFFFMQQPTPPVSDKEIEWGIN